MLLVEAWMLLVEAWVLLVVGQTEPRSKIKVFADLICSILLVACCVVHKSSSKLKITDQISKFSMAHAAFQNILLDNDIGDGMLHDRGSRITEIQDQQSESVNMLLLQFWISGSCFRCIGTVITSCQPEDEESGSGLFSTSWTKCF